MGKKKVRYISRDRIESTVVIWEEDLPQLTFAVTKNGGQILYAIDANDDLTEPVEMANPAQAPKSRVTGDKFNQKTELYDLGYRITGLSRKERLRILTERAIPQLGLERVANIIAAHVRNRKRQRDGMRRFHDAITEWEHDLAYLKEHHFDWSFPWPSTDV